MNRTILVGVFVSLVLIKAPLCAQEYKKPLIIATTSITAGIFSDQISKLQFSPTENEARVFRFIRAVEHSPIAQNITSHLDYLVKLELAKNLYFFNKLPIAQKPMVKVTRLEAKIRKVVTPEKQLKKDEIEKFVLNTLKKPTTDLLEKMYEYLVVGGTVTTALVGGITGMYLPKIIKSPKTVIPVLVSNSLAAGAVAGLSVNAATYYVDKNTDALVNKGLSLYQTHLEETVNKELLIYITNNIQGLKKLFQENNCRLVSSMIKLNPCQEGEYLKVNQEDIQKAFALLNEDYLQEKAPTKFRLPSRLFLARHFEVLPTTPFQTSDILPSELPISSIKNTYPQNEM